jgi:hypothetical protein
MTHAFPARSRSQVDMGSPERSVRTYLKSLKKPSFWRSVQRGLGKTNLYRLFLTVQKKSARQARRP